MIQDIYTVKELAQKWKSSQETVRNLIHDKRLRPMKMPTLIIPLFEVERFEKEMVATQEDLSKYADKQFAKKYLDKKEPAPIVEIRKRSYKMHNDWKGVVATIVVIIIMFAVVEFKDRSK